MSHPVTDRTGQIAPSQSVTKSGVGPTPHGVVAAQQVLAAQAGAEVLAAGGHAVDAAVATAFALGVVEPWMSGPGGGGGMLVWSAGARPQALHFGMRASASLDTGHYPLLPGGVAAESDLFAWAPVVEDRNIRGWSAVAVPGMVAGAAEAHARHGRLPWRDLLDPAIRLARQGLALDWYAGLMIASAARDLALDAQAAAQFLDRDDSGGLWPRVAGWSNLAALRLDQGALADTLEQIAQGGADAFYRGDIAVALAAEAAAGGGYLTRADLAEYRADWMEPLAIDWRGQARFWVLPERSAGPALAEAMRDWQSVPPGLSPEAWAGIATGLRQAYARRLSDDDDMGGQGESPASPACTTHFSVVDAQGNMVSWTQKLLSSFGARVVSPATGMLVNNGLMWFDPVPGRANSLAAGKACLMNICPLLGQAGDRQIALGASGGRKIMPAVGQIAAFWVDGDLPLAEAIAHPRIDVSGGPEITADHRLAPGVVAALARVAPVSLARRQPFPYAFACPAGVTRQGGLNRGAAETLSPWGDAAEEP
ncbi:gamma-glutamyltransferase [Pseudogemmobacter sonorensis]|uniref:gamma-glutamyltransferase n=1 Tax=Pseudogemmobacter sonorensis TaxID=2989681 RepID=UPI0036D0CACF